MILCDVPSGKKEITADTVQDTPLAVTHTHCTIGINQKHSINVPLETD